jgi:hypothetical protein
MNEEKTGEEDKRRSRMRLLAVMGVLIVVGIALYALPIFLYPDNFVHDATLSDANSHTTDATLDLQEGTYEVFMTTSLWSIFYLDQPLVSVNGSGNRTVHVDYVMGGSERSIEGDDCRHFATFEIGQRGEYDVSITAGVMELGIPGTERVYVVEERPSMYAPLQWSGILVILLGIVGLSIILVLMAMTATDEKRTAGPRAPVPPPAYPPPGYAPYPQQQPPAYQYPQQQPPPYPPPQGQPPMYPPPQGQPPPYQPPPQPPHERKGRSKY